MCGFVCVCLLIVHIIFQNRHFIPTSLYKLQLKILIVSKENNATLNPFY